MAKPFLTIDEQVALLESRGVSCGPGAGDLLMREGYYNIVNGYRAPFLDRSATEEAGDDRYAPGTALDDMYALFCFDRTLREKTFHHTLKAEALVRTACSYHFAEAHRGTEDYLLQSSYASEAEYSRLMRSDYLGNLQKLMQTLFEKARKSTRGPIAHYREEFGAVPIWVLSCDLTFGNMEHFFDFMKPAEQGRVCSSIARATGRSGGHGGYYGPKQARADINTVVKVRNMCAHDERLYCARIGGRKGARYADFLKCVGRLLTEEENAAFVASVMDDVRRFAQRGSVFAHIVASMGLQGQGAGTSVCMDR